MAKKNTKKPLYGGTMTRKELANAYGISRITLWRKLKTLGGFGKQLNGSGLIYPDELKTIYKFLGKPPL